jgi:hypothetical protein
MSWSGVLSTVQTHCETAGAALTPPITYVRASEPVAVPQDMIAYWYDGDQESTTGGNTFGKVNTQERLTITFYWRVEDRKDSYAADLEVTARTANRALHAALWGDVKLGGNCIGIDMGPTQMAWAQHEPGKWARTLTATLIVDLAETEDIDD